MSRIKNGINRLVPNQNCGLVYISSYDLRSGALCSSSSSSSSTPGSIESSASRPHTTKISYENRSNICSTNTRAVKNLLVVPEVEFLTSRGHKVYPNGTLKDSLRQDWGYWESKYEKNVLVDEIKAKFAKGHPSFNIPFEDSRTASSTREATR